MECKIVSDLSLCTGGLFCVVTNENDDNETVISRNAGHINKPKAEILHGSKCLFIF